MWLRIKSYVIGLGLFLVGIVLVYLKGRSDAGINARYRQLKEEVDAHDRISDADTGGGATDAERIKRLRDMADEWSH